MIVIVVCHNQLDYTKQFVGFGVFDVVGFGVAAGVLVFDGVCIIGSDVGFGVLSNPLA